MCICFGLSNSHCHEVSLWWSKVRPLLAPSAYRCLPKELAGTDMGLYVMTFQETISANLSVFQTAWFQSTLVWLCIFSRRIGMFSAPMNWRKLSLALVSVEKGLETEGVLRACNRRGMVAVTRNVQSSTVRGVPLGTETWAVVGGWKCRECLRHVGSTVTPLGTV